MRTVLTETGVRTILTETGVRTILTETGVRTVLTETGVRTVLTETGVRTVLTETGVRTVLTETGVRTVLTETGPGCRVFSSCSASSRRSRTTAPATLSNSIRVVFLTFMSFVKSRGECPGTDVTSIFLPCSVRA